MESIEDCNNEACSSNAEEKQKEEAEEKQEEEAKEDATLIRLIPGYETFEEYLEKAYDSIRAGTRTANKLPAKENYTYYTCFPSFNNARHKIKDRILDTMQSIVKIAGGDGNIKHGNNEEKFDLLLEINDLLQDRARACIDQENGSVKNPEVELVVTQMSQQVTNGSWNAKIQQPVKILDEAQNVRLLGGKNIQRPQFTFKDKIDNSSRPWQPRIEEKPNSLKPLALYLEEDVDGEIFNHPYEYELDRFKVPKGQLKERVPIQYKSLDDTQLIIIEKVTDIKIVLEDLKNYNEIAVDLEHHSYRTFQGITCLMQISTADTDYLIDTINLRSELYQFNEIFTKPSILKVFHGADLDIQWLQRDLSLYIVNMFDTHQAAKQLNLPYLSLAYLLKKYCGIDPNKHFQLADWRIRPLPEELMKYAREDTHYLLHIKDVLTNELIQLGNEQNNILKAVYDRSTEICKRRYVKPVWTEESCMSMYRKNHKTFNNKQMYALIELHRWRDITAREEDDSVGYILPNHMLLNIAETLPREIQGILACCNPIPPLVRQNLLKLHKIILKAREQPLVKLIQEQDFQQRLTQTHTENVETWIHLHHDIPSGTETRQDLPCLLDKNDGRVLNFDYTIKHAVTVFDTPVTSENEESNETKADTKKLVFISPFKRYKCVIPMIAEEEAKRYEKQKNEEEKKRKLDEEANKNKKIEKVAIEESKNRVHEHFKQVIQSPHKETQQLPKKGSKRLTLGQMRGRKRKRGSYIAKEDKKEEKNDDFSTPTPSLDTKIVHISKQTKLKMQNEIEELEIQETLAKVQRNKNPESINPISRIRKKGEKKANAKLLAKQNMLPAKTFDYKSVDFSSFQGGSRMNNTNQTNFQHPKLKKKERKKWKKQKLNI